MSMKDLARDPRQVGNLVRRARKKQRLSQSQLGDKAGLRQETISLIETGHPAAKLQTILGILAALDLELRIVPRSKAMRLARSLSAQLATIALCLATCVAPVAQAARQFAETGNGRGLTATVVTSLLVDVDGLLWVGSREGLYRYDGYLATAFRPVPYDRQSLSDIDVRALYQGSDGSIWVSTNTAGLNRLDPRTGRFTRFAHDSRNPSSLSDPSVFGVAEDSQGRLWVGTQRGLNRLDPRGLAARAVLARHQTDPGRELAPAVELARVAHHRNDRRGGGLAHAHQLHQLLRGRALLGHRVNMRVVLLDALVQVADLAEQVADHEVGVAGQLFQLVARLAAHDFGLERQHDAQLAERATDAVDAGGACANESLARAVHHQSRLLLLGLDGHEAHVGPLHRFADCRRVCRVVLASLAAHAVGRDELGCHQAHGVAVGLELARPVVRTRARLDADGARRQRRHQCVELGSRNLGLLEPDGPTIVHAMQ